MIAAAAVFEHAAVGKPQHSTVIDVFYEYRLTVRIFGDDSACSAFQETASIGLFDVGKLIFQMLEPSGEQVLVSSVFVVFEV